MKIVYESTFQAGRFVRSLAIGFCLAGLTISIAQAKDFRADEASALGGKSKEDLKVEMDDVVAGFTLKPFYEGPDKTGTETTGNWIVQEDGSLFLEPRKGETGWKRFDAYLWAESQYEDFVIDFEYKFPVKGNSGFYFRVADKTDPVQKGCELQFNDTAAKGDAINHHDIGGLLKTHPAAVNAGKPAEEWNRMIVHVQGDRLKAFLNGFQIHDIDLSKTAMKDRPAKGFIGFQDHGLNLWLRNVKVADLSRQPAQAKTPAPTPPKPVSGVEGITLSDPNLVAELIDTHPSEFFLSHTMDLSGRLFMGSREALFVYERTADGGFEPRHELFRFPKNTWVYDIETYGDDLLVLTNTALFRFKGAIEKRENITPERILWGNPMGHYHQGMHAIEFAPNGDLLIVMGDPHPNVHLNRKRPDHLWHWTWYKGPENKPQSYTGVGAVLRLNLENYEMSVYARGLRNACGISFDADWNLFTNDNDQEGTTAAPGRLMYMPPHSWGGWARGWSGPHEEKRLDLLPAVNIQLDVPVGQSLYDSVALGEKYRGSVMVANWGSHSVTQYAPKADGAGFNAKSEPFLIGDGNRRPVSVMPTNNGNLVVSVCYMGGNEGSPQRQTDLILVSPRKAESGQFDFSKDSLVDLLSSSWDLQTKAHQEILRQGGAPLAEAAKKFSESDENTPGFSSLIYLAAANGDKASNAKISSLVEGKGRSAILAWRVAAAFPEQFKHLNKSVNQIAARTGEPALLIALFEFLHAGKLEITSPQVMALAAHDDPYVRQTAAILLAEHLPQSELVTLSKGDSSQRLAAIMTATFRLWGGAEKVNALPKGAQAALEKQMRLDHPSGPVDMRDLKNQVGVFMLADWWANPEIRETHNAEFTLLKNALADEDIRLSTAAATALFFLNDESVNNSITAVLQKTSSNLSLLAPGAPDPAAMKAARLALKKAKLSTDTTIPAAFKDIDWKAKDVVADSKKGKELFTQRGCIACHLAPDDGKGGAIGPTLVGARDRFPADYLAVSILIPNLTVSPNFHPNTLTMKDGTVHTGFVEPGDSSDIVRLRVITGQIMKITAADIAKRDVSEQSMMPAGMIQTPQEMHDLIGYLSLPLVEEKKTPKKKKKRKK